MPSLARAQAGKPRVTAISQGRPAAMVLRISALGKVFEDRWRRLQHNPVRVSPRHDEQVRAQIMARRSARDLAAQGPEIGRMVAIAPTVDTAAGEDRGLADKVSAELASRLQPAGHWRAAAAVYRSTRCLCHQGMGAGQISKPPATWVNSTNSRRE